MPPRKMTPVRKMGKQAGDVHRPAVTIEKTRIIQTPKGDKEITYLVTTNYDDEVHPA